MIRVLLADDNEFNQKIICRILSTLSCDVRLILVTGSSRVLIFFIEFFPLYKT